MSAFTVQKSRFPLGLLCATHGALNLLSRLKLAPSDILTRHRNCDWGDIDDEDKGANTQALVTGDRLLSSYNLTATDRLWIITEADRSVTTLLLPEEY